MAKISVMVAVHHQDVAGGGSSVISVGASFAPATSFPYQPYNIMGQVSISSATLNAAAQSAYLASGASLT